MYHCAPQRCFLVENKEGKWIYWGHCQIIELNYNSKLNETSGKFVITKIYDPEYQKMVMKNEISSS